MVVLDAAQVRAWDEYSMREEPIGSIDLMERAASACFRWLMSNGYHGRHFSVFCGKGNNGGDGLAIARLLVKDGHSVTVNILEFGHKGTNDFQTNLARLHETDASIRFLSTVENFQSLPDGDIIVDALFGTGINRPLEGLAAALVQHINNAGNEIIAIDLPSGLYADRYTEGPTVVRANHTLSFQCYKPALLVACNFGWTGFVHILDIGLHIGFLAQVEPYANMIDRDLASTLLRKRLPFSHKGQYGHAALIAGSFGMMGAAVLAAAACLRSGAGKLTCHIPSIGYNILQQAVPEAMCQVEPGEKHMLALSPMARYDAIGIGPGIGLYEENVEIIRQALQQTRHPVLVDADGLNVIASHPGLLKLLPAGSVITPHVKEFERLFGPSANDFERISAAKDKAKELNIQIILKGHFSLLAASSGNTWFNSTGNPGMATAGTGDVLTGIITGLLAQGYPSETAACLAVYLHGRAGDIVAGIFSQESLLASDITEYLGNAFKELY